MSPMTRSSSRVRASSRRSRRAASSSSSRCPTSSPATACCGRSRATRTCKLIRVCKEDECVGIASGLSYSDKRALMLIQHTGFLDSHQRHPRRRGRVQPADLHDGRPAAARSAIRRRAIRTRYGVRIIEPILDAMGIPHHLHRRGAPTSARSSRRSTRPTPSRIPVALLIGRRPSRHDEARRMLPRRSRATSPTRSSCSTYSSAVDWLDLGERTLNYFSDRRDGARLVACAGAGARPAGQAHHRACDGDGSLLMNLGCLVTIAAAAPKNLVHFVVQNGTYEANGGHPIPNTETSISPAWRARPATRHAYDFSELQNLRAAGRRMCSSRMGRCSRRCASSGRGR